jgi:hypothetical protein
MWPRGGVERRVWLTRSREGAKGLLRKADSAGGIAPADDNNFLCIAPADDNNFLSYFPFAASRLRVRKT